MNWYGTKPTDRKEHVVFYQTIEEATMALTEARLDCEGDFGADAADAAHNDLVRAIADGCAPDVADELLRRNGIEDEVTFEQAHAHGGYFHDGFGCDQC